MFVLLSCCPACNQRVMMKTRLHVFVQQERALARAPHPRLSDRRTKVGLRRIRSQRLLHNRSHSKGDFIQGPSKKARLSDEEKRIGCAREEVERRRVYKWAQANGSAAPGRGHVSGKGRPTIDLARSHHRTCVPLPRKPQKPRQKCDKSLTSPFLSPSAPAILS